jgi:hypothetical protein
VLRQQVPHIENKMRVLGKDEFVTYANVQIGMAAQILAGHRPGANCWCACGRQLPCTVAAHATATRDWYQAKLALLDATKVLPVLAPVVKIHPVPLWRRLLGV